MTLLLSLVSSLALGANVTVSNAPVSPVLDQDRMLDSLASLCGEVRGSDVWGHYRDVQMDGCDVWFDAESANFTVSLDRGDPPSRARALNSAERDEVTAADWLVFDALGFDEADAGDVQTLELVVDSRDLRSGELSAESYIATKTFFMRSFEGFSVGSSRVVVTRDVDGAIRSIVGCWPDFSGSTVIWPDGKEIDPREAAELLGLDGATVDRRVLYMPANDGRADIMAIVDSAMPTFDPATAEKITTYYLIDGKLFEPLLEESWY